MFGDIVHFGLSALAFLILRIMGNEFFSDLENRDIVKGSFRLTFEEECDIPEDAKCVMDVDPQFTLYYDPDGLDRREIVCSTRKHRIRFTNCVLEFPNYPTERDAKDQDFKELITYRCTSYRAIVPRY